MLGFANQMCGINVINIHSTKMFESMKNLKTGQILINPRQGNVLNGLFEIIGVCLTPCIARSTKSTPRRIIIAGFYIMSLSMALNGLFAFLGLQKLLLCSMQLFLVSYQASVGSQTYVYISQVCTNSANSLATMVLFASIILISLITEPLFNSVLNVHGTFWLFSFSSFVLAIFFNFTMQESYENEFATPKFGLTEINREDKEEFS